MLKRKTEKLTLPGKGMHVVHLSSVDKTELGVEFYLYLNEKYKGDFKDNTLCNLFKDELMTKSFSIDFDNYVASKRHDKITIKTNYMGDIRLTIVDNTGIVFNEIVSIENSNVCCVFKAGGIRPPEEWYNIKYIRK